MATILVAGAKPTSPRHRRLSLRRGRPAAGPRPEPPRPQPQTTAVKEAVELLLWTDIETWQQHGSEHIQTGYRRASGSVAECVSSWLYVHNETVNIHSHILGALVFLALPGYFLAASVPPRYRAATAADVAVCCTYFVGVAACFVLSTAFHTLMAHSRAVYLLGMKLDFQGVLVLMWAATAPLVYYTFPCRDGAVVRVVYAALFTALAGACSAVTFLPRFSGPHLGPYRAALFGAFGAGSFAVPITHGLVRYGLDEMWRRVGLGWILGTVVCNGVGVGVYGFKFPERWFPRRFDLFGASHQLMHICVVAAALTYTCAVVQAFDYRHAQGAVC